MPQTYTVKSGDTLSGIGKQFGVPYKQITGFKSGNPNLIYPGEVLTIPGGDTPPQTTALTTTPQNNQVGSTEELGQLLGTFQDSVFTTQSAVATKIPSKTAINPATGKQYAVNPATGNFDDNYWVNVVEPRLKAQAGGGGGLAPLPTFEELKGQLTPGARPEVPKLEETFQALREERGLEGLETKLNALKAQEDEVFATLRQRVQAARGKPVPLGVIAGRIGELEQQERENLDFIQRQKSRVIDELNTANATIAQIMQLKQLDYGNAKADYDTQFNQNLQVFDLMRGLRRDQIDEQQRQIDNARANLQIYANAAMGGNLNYGQMSAEQKLTINRLEVQSGLPIGFIGSLGMSITERIITVNEKTGEALIVGENGQLEVISTGLTPTPTVSGV